MARAMTSAKKASTGRDTTKGFTAEERDAMRERVRELKAGKEDGEAAVRGKIALMHGPDRALAERLHTLIRTNAPGLTPRLWYGMPAYSKDGEVVCFFQPGEKFKTRYATLGFSDAAHLDDGPMWPTSYALTESALREEARIAALLRKATG